LACAWISYNILEWVPHVEDEFANLWQAHVMAKGEIFLPSPPIPRAFLIPFVIDYQGMRFGKYPPGWPAALSLGVRAGIPYLVSPILGGLAIWLIYRLGSKISRPGVGFLAALLAATSPMLLMLSSTLMPHALSLFLALAFVLAWLDLFPWRGASEGQGAAVPPWMLILTAGLSLGALALTRPLTALGVALPFVIHGLIILIRGGREQRLHAIITAAIVLVVALMLPLWHAALTGDPWFNPYTLWWSYDQVGFGPGHGRTEDGHNLTSAVKTMLFTMRGAVHDLFGWPYLSWLFIPLGMVALKRRRDGWLALAVLPSLIVIHFAYWVGSWIFGPRYYYEALPGVAISSALGVAWMGGWLRSASRWVPQRRAISLALISALILMSATMYLPVRIGSLHGLYGVERAAMEPVREAELGKALLIVHTSQSWYEYGSLVTLGPPFCEGDLLLALSRGVRENEALIQAYPGYRSVHYYPGQSQEFYENAP
jgi:hypothetical protein